ncbi:unnamed protein product [Prorocentrum cordatum]|uniref:Secreted protein n=1 Tax=Prorocentrum cordatum TaxID=2364126 RepID=A0ABN9U338_9DINO|nr:unnamed protein product [Polarella glacialis]|mmetsp:Transcript_74910/g.195248  ORF Transcript_74910/g.195248 Transcript_74910/m.195248 type:complete len:107 (-) Transcript_74910:61-381(-)
MRRPVVAILVFLRPIVAITVPRSLFQYPHPWFSQSSSSSTATQRKDLHSVVPQAIHKFEEYGRDVLQPQGWDPAKPQGKQQAPQAKPEVKTQVQPRVKPRIEPPAY